MGFRTVAPSAALPGAAVTTRVTVRAAALTAD